MTYRHGYQTTSNPHQHRRSRHENELTISLSIYMYIILAFLCGGDTSSLMRKSSRERRVKGALLSVHHNLPKSAMEIDSNQEAVAIRIWSHIWLWCFLKAGSMDSFVCSIAFVILFVLFASATHRTIISHFHLPDACVPENHLITLENLPYKVFVLVHVIILEVLS